MSPRNIDGDCIEPLPPIVSIPPDVWAQLQATGFTDYLPNKTRSSANEFIEWICENGRRLAATSNATSFYNQDDELVLRIRLVHPGTHSIRAWEFTFELLDDRGGEYYGLRKVERLVLSD